MGRQEIIRPRYDAERHVYFHPTEEKRLAGFSEIAKAVGMQDFSAVPRHALNHARDVGTAVHLATRYHDEGRLVADTVSEEIQPYLDAWQAFLRDTGFVPEEIERPVANLTWGYACTGDRIGHFPGNKRRWVVEVKKAASMEWHHVQVEAQSLCYPGENGKYIVQVLPTGKWKPHPVTSAQSRYYRQIWYSAVSVYHFTHKTDRSLWRP